MFPGYKVSSTVNALKTLPPGQTVFLSFAADPAPVIFYAANQALEHRFFSDIPYNSVINLISGAWIVLRNDEDPAVYEKRFGGKLELQFHNKLHKVFILRGSYPIP